MSCTQAHRKPRYHKVYIHAHTHTLVGSPDFITPYFIMSYAQQQRLLIIDKIRATFLKAHEKGLVLLKSDVISAICMQHGSSRRTAEQYISDLIYMRFIHQEGGFLALTEKTAADVREAQAILTTSRDEDHENV